MIRKVKNISLFLLLFCFLRLEGREQKKKRTERRLSHRNDCRSLCHRTFEVSLSNLAPEIDFSGITDMSLEWSIFDDIESSKIYKFCMYSYKNLLNCLNDCQISKTDSNVPMFEPICRDYELSTDILKCVQLQNRTTKDICVPKCQKKYQWFPQIRRERMEYIIAQLQYTSQPNGMEEFLLSNCNYAECLTQCQLTLYKIRCGIIASRLVMKLQYTSLQLTKEAFVKTGYKEIWPVKCDSLIENLSSSSHYFNTHWGVVVTLLLCFLIVNRNDT